MERLRAFLRATRQLSLLSRYVVATALVGVAAFIRWLLDPILAGYFYFVFSSVVFASALLFNQGAGLYATLLSAFVVVLVFIEPTISLSLQADDAVALFLFLAVSFLVTAFAESIRKLLDQLDDLERQKDLLFRELSHRTRNNFQIISSMLAVESLRIQDIEAKDHLRALAERVAGIARLQQYLFAPSATGERIDAHDFLDALCGDIALSLPGRRPVSIDCDIERIPLTRDLAASLGIMINELITNAIKHAFPEGKAGTVWVRLKHELDGTLVLSVADNGGGRPRNNHRGTGLELIASMLQRYHGRMDMEGGETGLQVTIHIPPS